MNIVETEALAFSKEYYHGREIISLDSLKSKLTLKLYDFNRDRDKLDFLKILRTESVTEKEEHLKKCQEVWCDFPKERDYGIFAIDQEIDAIKRYYDVEPDSADMFTNEDESNLQVKLNSIIEQLDRQGLGQEIIFNEIESLKDHFNLGKKTWFQLLKGKVVDLTLQKVLEETIVKEIYNTLSDGFDEAIRMIK